MTQSLALNSNRDLYIGTDGNLTVKFGLDATLQNCATAMQAQYGEMMYRKLDGMPTRETAWDRYNPRLFEMSARAVLLKVKDVTDIVEFQLIRTENELTYIATIATIYGTGVLRNG
jgi:hypothetical protein